ncbi:MAG TPA: response regulator [Anaerolineae bacterium]|nr:response regulator [Anaerolineae bacterium]HQK13584.1 response regulator [Anaerolineae bacterium]
MSVEAKPRIVIIENDLPTLELYRRELSSEYEVLATLDVTEALAMAQMAGVRAVVLEPALGGGKGWELLATLSQTAVAESPPVILCSTSDERRKGMALGVAAFLVKPVLPTALHQVLRRIIGKRPAAVTGSRELAAGTDLS